MKKTLVLYKSKTGFSEKYARWIAEELDCDLAEFSAFDRSKLQNYQLIIYGAGLYAGQINGIGKIKRWMEENPRIIWVVFATGATPDKQAYEELIFKSNFRQGEARPAHFFYLLAGINYEKMGFFNRLLMKIFGRMAAKKQGTTIPKKQTSVDLSNRVYIEDLLRYVRLKRR